MGLGGTGDRALGLLAVTHRVFAAVALCGLLTACGSSGQIAGLIAGGVTGGATGNPAIGFAVGVVTDAGATWAVRYYGRERQGAEQDAIAQVAGALPVGTGADWKIEHTIPIGNEHGRLRITGTIDSPLATCKEVVFSVDDGDQPSAKRDWYITDICKTAGEWKWAAAEPAVQRWGLLQ
jgi:hypothetical protein